MLNTSQREPKAVYLPDSGCPESDALEKIDAHATVNDALSALREFCGPPSPTIEAIYRELGNGVNDCNGYYVDDFADFLDAKQTTD